MTITSRLSHSLRLVKAFEVFHARATPQGDGFVIGYGHTASARQDAVVTRGEADALLIYDLGQIGRLVDAWVYAPMHDHQRQALIAFGFNIGVENLHRSTAMRRLNAGDYMGCAREIERWRMAELAGRGQVVDALVRRRAAEKALFLTPPEGFLKTASSQLQPRFDGDRSAPAPLPSQPQVEATSAAMTAAQNVTARLRALLPDAEPLHQASEPKEEAADTDHPAAPELSSAEPALDHPQNDGPQDDDTSTRETPLTEADTSSIDPSVVIQDVFAEPGQVELGRSAPSLEAGAPMDAPEPEVRSERPVWPLDEVSPPPPFVPSARRRVPTLVSANDFSFDGGEPSAPHPIHEPAAPASGMASAPAPTLRERLAPVAGVVLPRAHFFIGLFGVLLFVISVLAILTGKPSAANLGVGLLGVLCMTPTAYALLGSRQG